MSPIPTLAAASTLFTSPPLTTIAPGSPGQSGSTASQYILGTGGFLFAVVAIVSVAGYFCHGRGAANAAQKSNTWASLTGLLSSVRNIGSTAAATAATTDWPVYLENGPDHINVVYAKYFHPTLWNLVECHPATAFAPAICVEEEAIEVPTAENSFLHKDEDGEDRHGKGSTTPSRETSKNDTKARVEQVPPYDTSSPTNVKFDSKVIGTTARPGGFLYVPGQDEDDLSESSDSDSELDFGSLAYDGIVTAPLTTRPSSRRHGMADMGHLADSLKGALAEECEGMVPTVSFQTGLADTLELLETEHVLSCTPPPGLETLEDSTTSENRVETCTLATARPHDPRPRRYILSQQAMDNTPTDSVLSIASFDSCDNSAVNSSDVDTFAGSHSSVDLMWKLYDECLKAVGDTLDDDTNASDVGHDAQYDKSDAELIESCKPLRLRGTKDDGPTAAHRDASVHDNGYDTQSSFSKRQVDIDQSDSDNDISSYGSCDSFQSDSGSIESLERRDELDNLMSEIYTECLRSANQESTITGWDISDYDSQNDMHCGFRSISSNTREAAHQKSPSVAQRILSRHPGDNDSRTLDHEAGFYESYDDFQDSSTDINTLERPEDLEDLMSQIHAEYLYWSKSLEADTVASKYNVVHDDCGDMQLGTWNTDAPGTPHEGPELMRRILAELRDPSLDIDARDISEDSDSEYSDDDEEGGIVSRNSRRNSLQSSYSFNGTPDGDVSDEGSIYPLTPPPMSATSVIIAPNILDGCTSSPNMPSLHKEAQVVQSLPMFSPPALPREAYFLDPFLDCRPQDLSDDTYCEQSDDTEEEANIPRLRLSQGPHNERRGSLDCTSSNTGTDNNVSNKGLNYPLTLLSVPIPPVASTLDVRTGRVLQETPPRLAREVQVILPLSYHSPPTLPTRAHIPRASHRNSRSAMYGPCLPLQDLPRI